MIDCNKCANRCGLKEYYEQRGEHIVKCPSYKPQTNADLVRAMTDEELAEFCIWMCPPGYDETGSCEVDRERCYDCWLDWLRKEAQNG